jgi:predicted TIM-barrel fold metal-dependent hydrolase
MAKSLDKNFCGEEGRMDLDSLRGMSNSRGPKPEIAKYRPISADSHVTEHPSMYIDHIDPAFRDRAPTLQRTPAGDMLIVEGMDAPIHYGMVAAAGRDPKDIQVKYNLFEELHRGGWDPKARLKDQDADGVIAEIIYPSLGMIVSRMPDPELQSACMKAYNRWLTEYCAAAPDRLFGVGQTAVVSVESAIEDVKKIKEQGFYGIYMNGMPWTEEDYDDEVFDPLWATCVELELPICFHVFGRINKKGGNASSMPFRGKHKVNGWNAVVRDNQDLIGMFIFGSVFERHPDLKLVCVEADAGWAPHFMFRMDHMYMRHRYWQKAPPLQKLPSDYFKQNIWLTFQDDYVAFRTVDLMNERRLMWASDFPHGDSTWPWSHALLEQQTHSLTEEQKHLILHQNVVDLFKLKI